MSLLHATWLFPPEGAGGRLLLWADTWRVAAPVRPEREVPAHPFTLNWDDLADWLQEHDLWSEALRPAHACLTLPSRPQAARGRRATAEERWSGLPLQAGEPIPKQVAWWPWKVEGLAMEPGAAAEWLSGLPLSGHHPDLADELRWWSHLQRWAMSLIARGRWLPQVEEGRARWLPLLNREGDRRRLEDLASGLPQVASCAIASGTPTEGALACRRPGSGRLRVASLLEALLDGQLRNAFAPGSKDLDPLLEAWQKALGRGDGRLALDPEQTERLETATHHWREAVAGRVAPARACLELFTPADGEELWELRFSLQAEAEPSLRLNAGGVWAAGDSALQLGEVEVQQPGELLLEGLGRALQVFEPLGRGLESATPEQMRLSPAEALSKIGITNKFPVPYVGGSEVRTNSYGNMLQSQYKETLKGLQTKGSTIFALPNGSPGRLLPPGIYKRKERTAHLLFALLDSPPHVRQAFDFYGISKRLAEQRIPKLLSEELAKALR